MKKYLRGKYEGICGKYEEIRGNNVENVKKYEENNMKKQVALEPRTAKCESSYILFFLYNGPGTWNKQALRLRKIASFTSCIGSGTWKSEARCELSCIYLSVSNEKTNKIQMDCECYWIIDFSEVSMVEGREECLKKLSVSFLISAMIILISSSEIFGRSTKLMILIKISVTVTD